MSGVTAKIRSQAKSWTRRIIAVLESFDGDSGVSSSSAEVTVEGGAQRNHADRKIEQLNRVHTVHSSIGQAIIREKDQLSLFNASCRIAVEKGRFQMAWIGTKNAQSGGLEVQAQAGADPVTRQVVERLVARRATRLRVYFSCERTGKAECV